MDTLPLQKARVVVVDDEERLAWVLGMLLRKAGYDVVTFTNPLRALDEVRERPADVIVSDVVMPHLSGIELAMQLQQEQPACKVILLSGQANTVELLSQARSKGFTFEVFPKPIPAQDLIRLVYDRAAN